MYTIIIGTLLQYVIYNKYETNADDLSVTNQNINKRSELTLVTCNNLNGNRIIIKAQNK